jgi:hypothetical protein
VNDHPGRIRLRADLEVHAARIITSSGIDYDQTACGVTVTLPESDNGCVYLDPSRTITCPKCQTAIAPS